MTRSRPTPASAPPPPRTAPHFKAALGVNGDGAPDCLNNWWTRIKAATGARLDQTTDQTEIVLPVDPPVPAATNAEVTTAIRDRISDAPKTKMAMPTYFLVIGRMASRCPGKRERMSMATASAPRKSM